MFTKRKAFSGSGLTKMTSVDCCDVDLRDRFGRTPLMYAVLGNYPACIEVIEKKVQFTCSDCQGFVENIFKCFSGGF